MAEFDDLAAFAAVVRAKSFTRAAAQMGVTQSALSQTVRALERRLDLKLLNRTTRSVSPTDAGERLFLTVEPRLAEIEAELAVLGNMRGRPVGNVRITATEHAVRSIVWPRLLPWLPNFPEIKIEISSDNRFVDIVAERFDIGIRLGGDVAKNMIALRIAPDMRMVVVGSPAYLKRNPPPQSLQELSDHDCIGLRLPTYGGLLAWEFKNGGKITNVHVEGRLLFNRSDLMADAAVAGHGLAWLPEDMVQEHLAAGRLVTVLDDWGITFPGYHLYYASRRSSLALSLVIDALRIPKSR
ncbi:LysR family transcriptional regulator [Collimonas sp. NPDC087041]|uniref:LysR family transcriptional regulator n=1 Tax=Collimonas sp. NPDC087041 TaxID=3363960 RepID=UPI003825C31A